MVDTPIKPVKVSVEEKKPVIKRPDPVELVRQLLHDEELVRPVKIPIVSAPPLIKRKVRKVKDRKPTLPTRVIQPPKVPELDEVIRPKLIVRSMALPPPPPPRRTPKIHLEPNYPITSPRKNRLPQQPTKYLMESTIYHDVSAPSVLDHTPLPKVKPLPKFTPPIWTDLYRKQALIQAEEVVVVPEMKTLPPRPVKRVKPHEPIAIPEPVQSSTEWIDVTDYEMPIRGARRRHLVMPTDNTFERQMRDFTLQLNEHKLKREDAHVRRQRVFEEEERRAREESFEVEQRQRMSRRTRSMPPVPRYDMRIKAKTPEYSPVRRHVRDKTPDIPRVTPLKPSMLDDWSIQFKRQAARSLVEPYIPPSEHSSTPYRRKVHAPSRIWMPSDEYHHVTDKQVVKQKVNKPVSQPVQPYVPQTQMRSSPEVDDSRLRMLRDDIELNKRRRAQIREQRDEIMSMSRSRASDDDVSSMRSLQFEIERSRRSDRMSMPPLPTIQQRKPFHRPMSPIRQLSPSPSPSRPRGGVSQRRRPPIHARGVSLPPQEVRGRHVPHLPLQPSKFWLPSGEYHHITDDEFKHISEENELRQLKSHHEESLEMRKLEQEFEKDRQRRDEKRMKHEQELQQARQEDQDSFRLTTIERQRKMRQYSMPPLQRKDMIKAENIPKAQIRAISPPAAYKPTARTSAARQQEIEIETITKRINENIESYEDSLKRRHHHTIPIKKVVASPIHMKKRPKTDWSALYTTVTERIEEKSDSEDEEWITLRKKRNKRHLVVPSAELSRSLTTKSVAVPEVLVSHRSAASRQDHGSYNVVQIREMDVDHTRVPPPRPHFTEDAEFDSDWHAMVPHVREGKRVRVRGSVRVADEKHAPSYDKRTPAADDWMSRRERKTEEIITADYETPVRGRRHLITPPHPPRRSIVRKSEPLSVMRLEEKTHHTRHAIEERELEPEPVFHRRRERRSRHNLVIPGWQPGESSSAGVSRRESPPRFAASSPVGRGRSFTPMRDSITSVSPVRPMSMGRSASVSYIPRQTPSRDVTFISCFDQSSRHSAHSSSVERGAEYDVVSNGSRGSGGQLNGSEHHVHPMMDTFKGAVEKVRERIPWRQLYNEATGRTHTKHACK